MDIEIVEVRGKRRIAVHNGAVNNFFGYNMIKNNDMGGIVSPEISKLDGRDVQIYELDGCRPLVDYIGEKTDLERVRHVLDELWERILRCEEYVLDPDNLIYEIDNIFVEFGTDEIKVLYLEEYDHPVIRGFCKIVERIIESLGKEERELLLFLYSVHRTLSASPFNPSDVEAVLRGEKEYLQDKGKVEIENARLVEENAIDVDEKNMEDKREIAKEDEQLINNRQMVSVMIALLIIFFFAMSPYARGEVSNQIEYIRIGIVTFVVGFAELLVASKLK
ncbi:MAG: DUF6382 domain-containing protein [Eubacterium sp.]|nr:DUF6382 domain-containing protein [Eubacterium sp.]